MSSSKFLIEIYNDSKGKNDFIKRMLFSLYLLTYYEIGQPNSDHLADFTKNTIAGKKRKSRVLEILDDKEKFDKEYKIFSKS